MKLAAALFPIVLAAASSPQAIAQASQDPPIQVWLDHDGSYEQGDPARVWVRAARDGFLLILHSNAEGRVRVLFPLDPVEDDFVRGGVSLEVRGRADAPALYIDERTGDGLILAVWSADPFRFDGYVRGDHWDYRALAADGSTRDAEAGLLDVAYRVADGRPFDYATAPYIVGRPYSSGVSHVSYTSISYSTDRPWCYGCYDDWRFGFGFGLGFRSGFSLHIGFGSPWAYQPWFYDPFYAFGHPAWYRTAYYDPFYYHPIRPYGVWGWDPWYYPRSPFGWAWGPGPRYRYAGIGIRHGWDDGCRGDPFCRRDPYRTRSGWATGIALGPGIDDRGGPRRDGYVTPRGYAQGRENDRSGSSTRAIGLSEEIGRSTSAIQRTASIAGAGDNSKVITSSEPRPSQRSSFTSRLREAVQSEPPQRSSSATSRLREAVQSEPPSRSSASPSRARDRSDQGISRAPTRVVPERSGITRAAPPERSSSAAGSARSRSVPTTRSAPPRSSSSGSGTARAGGSATSRGAATARASGATARKR